LRHRRQAARPARAAFQRTEPPARLGKPCAVPPAADAGAARRADGAADARAPVAGTALMFPDRAIMAAEKTVEKRVERAEYKMLDLVIHTPII